MRLIPSARVVFALLLPVLGPAVVSAQQEGREVTFRTLCFQHQDGLMEAKVASGKGKGGAFEVPLLSGNFSEQIKARFLNETAFLFVDDATAPDGRKVIARGKLASAKLQIFLLLPDPSKKMPYRIVAMNDDEKSFPMGSVRILNLCPGPVRFNFAGTDMKPIQPGKIVVYPPVKSIDEWGMYQVGIAYGTPEGKWITVATPSWKSVNLKRDFVITALDPRSKQPRISYYKDIPPWRKPNLVVPDGGS